MSKNIEQIREASDTRVMRYEYLIQRFNSIQSETRDASILKAVDMHLKNIDELLKWESVVGAQSKASSRIRDFIVFTLQKFLDKKLEWNFRRIERKLGEIESYLSY